MPDWLRTARTRRLGLAVVLVALLALLGATVARGLPTSPPRAVATATRRDPPTERTFFRRVFSAQLPLVATAHPGDAYTLTWQPDVVYADPITGPTPVACLLAFYGPYATGGEAAQVFQRISDALRASSTTGLTPVFAAPPLSLDALSGAQQQETITFPDDLAGGWYVVIAQSGEGPHLVVGGSNLRIVPRGA